MSFFRNIRSSITRSKSTSRDTTPVRNTTAFSSRPGSVISNATTTTITTGGGGDRRDSVDSRTDSLFNRSDTFILGGTSDQEENKSHSNSSTLEKKSKKSKVLSKFSTFTKRKKTPSPEEHGVYEHHPSDNATNTYYKWKSDNGPSSLDYDTQSDPFNFLYEQQSNLKALHSSASTNSDIARSNSSASGQSNNAFDSSTYRKSKMPTQLKEQLEHLKTNNKSTLPEVEDDENEGDKFKTITLNSFRKSFREKFLQQQKDVPHNPAWFVEVEKPDDEKSTQSNSRARRESKENRPDFLVFENENYRPHSRSPVRSPDRSGRTPRAATRSPVKRNETFRVENPSVAPVNSTINSTSMTTTTPKTTTTTTTSAQPSIRIEIKNSITPNMPVRVVPVGIAKPFSTESYQQRTQFVDNAYKPKITTTSIASTVPVKSWPKSTRGVSPAAATKRTGRYQTLVQIGNEANIKSQTHSAFDNCCSPCPTTHVGTPFGTRGSSNLSTCIQLKGNGASPTIQKRLHSAGSRYSLAVAPVTHNPTTLSSYEMLKNSTKPSALPLTKKPATLTTTTTTLSSSLHSKAAKPRHTTYFGDAPMQASTAAVTNEALHSRLLTPTAVAPRSFGNCATTAVTTNGYNSAGDYTPVHSRLYNQQTQSRSSYTAAVAGSGGGVGTAAITANTGYPNRRDQPQQQHAQSCYYSQTRPRITAMPLVQRRSRSPIKMPWR